MKFQLKEKIQYLKAIKENEELNKIVKKLPDSETVCKEILKQIGNEKVKIDRSKVENTNTSLYLVMSDKILIGNMEENFTRIQTIAHECIHSIQSQNRLRFHFFFSNFVQIFFIVCMIFAFLVRKEILQWSMLIAFIGASIVWFKVRYSLEKDAMTRAKDLAICYLQRSGKISKEEEKKIEKEYEKINKVGIPMYRNYLISRNGFQILFIMGFILIF